MGTAALLAIALLSPFVQNEPDGIRVRLPHSTVRLELRDPHTIRVQASADPAFFSHPSFVELPRSGPPTKFTVSRGKDGVILRTSELEAIVRIPEGQVSFADLKGRPILTEAGRTIQPAIVDGEQTFHVQQRWQPNPNESLYGLGQRPSGPLNIKGIDLDLWQRNTFTVVPFLASSRGYGIYWDNPSYTRFGDLRESEPIPADELIGKDGKHGGLTGQFYAGANFQRLVATRIDSKFFYPNPVSGDGHGFPGLTPPRQERARGNTAVHPSLPGGDVSIRWEGTIDPAETGPYLFDAYSNGGIRLYVGGRLLINHWRQSWLPERDVARIELTKNVPITVRLEWIKDAGANTMILRWKTPSPEPTTSLWSEVGSGVDYTFVYGPRLDKVVAGMRNVTGRAVMPPKWAFGLWQSRQRYENQGQSLDVVDGFRRRQIPFDNIVQDWFYWKADQWGSHEFDPARFPDPKGWIQAIHRQHANLMISVWGKFYPGTKNFDELRSKGFLYEPNLADGTRDWTNHPFTFFDPFTAESRSLFWSQIDRELFKKGVDAWWMDASEPDLMSTPNLEGHRARMTPTGLGKSSRGINLYALETARAVYEGQRKSAPDQRVFNLTRSGYAGQQRYGAATWSGDTSSTWTALERQIPAGLSFAASGIPYWTVDIGGFSVPGRFASRNASTEDRQEWAELNTRWFEFGTFVPLLRVHGEAPYREMWQFGGDDSQTYQAMLKFDRLRYRLLPYIYSLAGDVTQNGGSIMRPLVMDFPDDPEVRDLTDEYMFGKAFLVSPVLHYKQRVRPVILPPGRWFDFWTGRPVDGAQSVDSPAPYDQVPLFVRAGSIIPFGPELQYTTEKPADPITLVVYTGADATTSFYEDDGLTNAYERGESSRIPISWSDKSQTLTIGKREGAYKGMPQTRTFRIVRVSPTHPIPFSFNWPTQEEIAYSGSATTYSFKSGP